MKLLKHWTLLIIVFVVFTDNKSYCQSFSSAKRTFTIQRSAEEIHIDGKLDEAIWSNLTPIDNFIQQAPSPGSPSSFKTEVYLSYDDYAIYIAAKMYDDQPKKIFAQLSERDGIYNADRFSFMIDPYKGGTNGFVFYVSAANIQSDSRLYDGDEDPGWDAVWSSATSMTSDGWIAELKIPYSAIRLPNSKIQSWAVNFFREERRLRETSSWNPINPNLDGSLNQCGVINGIENIQTPLRLSISPYASFTSNKSAFDNSKIQNSFNGGMDLKLGLNDAFTLDATLVPDYSDVRSDDLSFNLSPFEVKYIDYRPFFTEGVDLFNKGGLFYSRRIGSSQLRINELKSEGIVFKELPSPNRIINASKLSGRTNSGLGIGIFNAIENSSYAIVLDSLQNESRIQINPLTNYNVLILDQTLPNNSSISLINTNVMREGKAYDANVSGTDFSLKNKSNSYLLAGKFVVSQKYKNGFKLADEDLGYTGFLGLYKTAGIYRYAVSYLEETEDYDPNDLGFLYSPNQREIFGRFSLNYETPRGNNINSNHNFSFTYDRLYKPDKFTNLYMEVRSFVLTKSWFAYLLNIFSEPAGAHDYYEPRVFDFKTYYAVPASYGFGGFISTNYSKPLALDLNADITFFDQKERYVFNAGMQPRILLTDHLSIFPSLLYSYRNNDEGRIYTDNNSKGIESVNADDILFGRRNIHTLSPNILVRLIFNEALAFNFRFYQNWNYIKYQGYGKLETDGHLSPTVYQGEAVDGTLLHDQSISFLSLDANFTWRFQPGSSLSLYYTQGRSLFKSGSQIGKGYFDNFGSLLEQNSNQTLGLKILYYL
ncbi:MAG TPA: DUF5916 domain-containing protein, partial [Saprospiraceae bacterium]|nr:DUF5916 domain-containing protein [Saprospiraceae bacterium]